MSVSPLHRWSDDRIDDLARRVAAIEPSVGSIGELRVEMRGLQRGLEAATKGLERFSEQFEKAQEEPLNRIRTFRSQAVVAIGAAIVGGGMAIFGALIVGTH